MAGRSLSPGTQPWNASSELRRGRPQLKRLRARFSPAFSLLAAPDAFDIGVRVPPPVPAFLVDFAGAAGAAQQRDRLVLNRLYLFAPILPFDLDGAAFPCSNNPFDRPVPHPGRRRITDLVTGPII